MYDIGSLVIYGSSGVCRVVSYDKPHYPNTDQNQDYYKLQPLFQDGVIYSPVNSRVFMRPVISREEAERVINMIPSIKAEAVSGCSVTQLAAHYEDYFKSHECIDLVELVMSIYNKKQQAESLRKKFGQMDERFMKRAEFLLYSELSVALGIPKEEVGDYIARRVEKMKQK